MKEKRTLNKIGFKALLLLGLCFFPLILFANRDENTINQEQTQNTITVQGLVSDEKTGEPLVGVSVLEVSTQTGVITDLNGHYSISLKKKGRLQFSYVGFQSQEVEITANRTLNLSLKEDLKHLDELVVVGYTTQKKVNLTGAVSSVEMSKLNDIPVGGVNSALQGRMSGVTVLQGSGAPGSTASIRIRGMGTFGNNEPLYIIDGLPTTGMNDINPSDIERIDVLKDAASAAIYGSRAANGVVLIQTKKGASSEKININFNTYQGLSSPQKKLKLLTAKQRNYIHLEAYQNAINDGQLDLDPEQDPREYYWSEYAQMTRTNWQDEIFNNAAYQGNYALTLSGGSKLAKYNITAGHLTQDGILKNTSFNRTNFRINTELNLSKNLKIGENLLITHSKRNEVPDAGSFAGAISSALLFDPAITPYNEAGKYNGSGALKANLRNPRSIVDRADRKHTRDRIFGNLYAEYTLLKDFTFKTDFGYDWFVGEEKWFVANYPESGGGNKGNELTQDSRKSVRWVNTTTLKFEKTMDKHYLMAIAGFSYEDYNTEIISGRGLNFISEEKEQRYLSAATEIAWLQGDREQSAMASGFGRIDYTYDNKYLLSANFRADGSSKFAKKNRWGYFPSVSAGWRISEETFFDSLKDKINNLKLRASWGVLGNQNIYSYYPTKEIIKNTTDNDGYYVVFGENEKATIGRYASNIPNPDIKWELTKQMDFGLDISFFNKFHLEIDFYEKMSSDVLIQVPLPSLPGATTDTWKNAASVRNRGFDANLTYSTQIKDFNIKAFANIGVVKNEVLNLSNERSTIFTRRFSGENIARTTAAAPISHFYGYKTDGIFHTQDEINKYINKNGDLYQKDAKPGDLKFVDNNGDGVINDNDKTNLGNGFPDFSYGFGLDLEYKGFDLNLFFQGVSGYRVFNALKYSSMFVDPRYNQYTAIMDRFHPTENPNGKLPRVTLPRGDKNDNKRMSDYYVEKGDYLRLKTLTVGYTFNKQLIEKLRTEKLRAYLTMQNPLTLTSYSGFDPELYDGFDNGQFPQTRSIVAGFSINF